MTQDGWLRAEWGVTEKNRQARFYAISRAGRKQLALEEESWARLQGGVQRVLGYACSEERSVSWLTQATATSFAPSRCRTTSSAS